MDQNLDKNSFGQEFFEKILWTKKFCTKIHLKHFFEKTLDKKVWGTIFRKHFSVKFFGQKFGQNLDKIFPTKIFSNKKFLEKTRNFFYDNSRNILFFNKKFLDKNLDKIWTKSFQQKFFQIKDFLDKI